MEEGQSIKMAMMLASVSLTKRKLTKTRVLYPFHLIEFSTIFMYGRNYQRGGPVFNASGTVQLAAGLIALFVVVTAIILWLFRRKLRLSRDEFQLSLMDTLILIIGGGNLQMNNRFERWFFGILLIGSFFLMAVFGGSLLDCFTNVSESKVRTFDDLAKINSTIIIDVTLSLHKDDIIEMLR